MTTVGYIDTNWDDISDPAARAKVVLLSHVVYTFVAALVDDEEAIHVTVRGNHRRVMFTVKVAENDVAFALGTGGRHADAIRVILIAACRKLKFHFDMDIVGPSGTAQWSST